MKMYLSLMKSIFLKYAINVEGNFIQGLKENLV